MAGCGADVKLVARRCVAELRVTTSRQVLLHHLRANANSDVSGRI